MNATRYDVAIETRARLAVKIGVDWRTFATANAAEIPRRLRRRLWAFFASANPELPEDVPNDEPLPALTAEDIAAIATICASALDPVRHAGKSK